MLLHPLSLSNRYAGFMSSDNLTTAPTQPTQNLPTRDQLLIVTPHSSGQLPADILHAMLGEDMFDSAKRAAYLEEIFLDGDPYTDLLYHVPAARQLQAAWSRFAVDLNRDRDENVDNGVIKMMNFGRNPLYPVGFVLSDSAREQRLRRIWDSFNQLVENELKSSKLMIVGHSMGPFGPKLGPDTGTPRPAICLMLGTTEENTFPQKHWGALQEACVTAFADVIAASSFREVKIGVPWEVDTLSHNHSKSSGVPAFGIEFNAGLYLNKGEPKDPEIRALNKAFIQFADAALTLLE